MALVNKLIGTAFALAALVLSNAPSWAQAQSQAWPNRTVKLILPLGPGSGVDITARLIADKLSAKWNQPVVVENRPGGDGVVALSAFASAKDDHTLLMSPTSSFTHHPWTHEKLPYDPREVNPIARVTNTIVAVVVPASSPIKSLKELVDTARAQPGKLNWATITGFFDFMFLGFQKKANLDIARVPYRDTVQAANDLAEGRIQLMMAAYAIVRPHIQSGKLRILAITAKEPAASVPGVPTAAQAGVPDLTIEGLVGLFGPRELPNEVRDRIAADVAEILRDPAINTRLTATGQVVNPGNAKEFAAAIDAQRAQAVAAGQLLGIKAAQF
jgi:tripartite-type tricarboxylate transporter receptor subunit TctC